MIYDNNKDKIDILYILIAKITKIVYHKINVRHNFIQIIILGRKGS